MSISITDDEESPVEEAETTVSSDSITETEEGSEIEFELEEDTYDVIAEAEGYETEEDEINVDGDKDFNIVLIEE